MIPADPLLMLPVTKPVFAPPSVSMSAAPPPVMVPASVMLPAFTRMLLAVFNVMRERYGYEMALLEGYRSPERQDRLAAAGNHVSNARAFQSYHQFGLAADCAFVRAGKLVISERDPWAMRGYQLYGEAAEAAGMVWGGRWNMMDFGHTELRTRDTRA